MSLASTAIKRTVLLTSTRIIRSASTITTTQTLRTLTGAHKPTYTPLITTKHQTRHFTATAKMGDGKEGVHNLKSKSEFDEAMGIKDTLMVVDCFATWCGPCKVIAPQVVK